MDSLSSDFFFTTQLIQMCSIVAGNYFPISLIMKMAIRSSMLPASVREKSKKTKQTWSVWQFFWHCLSNIWPQLNDGKDSSYNFLNGMKHITCKACLLRNTVTHIIERQKQKGPSSPPRQEHSTRHMTLIIVQFGVDTKQGKVHKFFKTTSFPLWRFIFLSSFIVL